MNIQDSIKDYYGKALSESGDLKTDACCTVEDTPDYLRKAIMQVHPDVRARYFGCGLVAPLAIEGCRILDLGSGAGQDAFVLSQLAGPQGAVVGIDMTPEQLAVARNHLAWHAEKFGYANTTFLEGDIERLDRLDLEPNSFDVIISNCVLNLVEDKASVLRAVHTLLRPGGEFYFADVYADRRLPEALRYDPILRGECLGGALYWNDFLNMAKAAGFADPRLVTDRSLSVNNKTLKERLGGAAFHSATYRLFKLEGLEPACEDYGQAVIYKGGLSHSEVAFVLDCHHVIEQGKVFPVCGNTCRMLRDSRFAPYFEFIGDGKTHFGIFPGCGMNSPFGAKAPEEATSGSCC